MACPAGFGGNPNDKQGKDIDTIVGGVILILLAALLDVGILYTKGGILVVVGAILWILGAAGRKIGPKARHY